MIGRRFFSSTALNLIKSTNINRPIPKPTAEIQDVNSFLTKIGRGCDEFAPLYENNWENLFKWKTPELKEKGVSAQQRRYILHNVERYYQGLKITEMKKGKKSFWGGERRRPETIAKWRAQERAKEHEEFMKQHKQ